MSDAADHDIDAFDYDLPPSLIADRPAPVRHESRLLVLDRTTGRRVHLRFDAMVDRLEPEDLLVFNDTRVLAARLLTRKVETGGRVELLLVEPIEGRRWRALARPARSLRPGLDLELAPGEAARVVTAEGSGFVVVDLPDAAETVCARHGAVPLPPYIDRAADAADRDRYQTVYARPDRARSVAAPTAGLHFSDVLLRRLDDRGVRRTALTLDVGPGTFLPVKARRLDEHRMHAERFEIGADAVRAIETCRARKGRIVAVGTTTVRALESLEALVPGRYDTRLFIRPGHRFRWIDELVTNFHLPRSTLLVLVSALAGRDAILGAYADAVERGYRFYSYGDAMWIR